jgi:hypothetical protein
MQSPSTDVIGQRLWEWRQAHPQATFDEIDEEVSRQFAGLQARVIEALSQSGQRHAGSGQRHAGSGQRHAGSGETPAVGDDPPVCPQCQSARQGRGQRRRRVPTRQGQDVVLQRPYAASLFGVPGLWGRAFPPWMRRSA